MRFPARLASAARRRVIGRVRGVVFIMLLDQLSPTAPSWEAHTRPPAGSACRRFCGAWSETVARGSQTTAGPAKNRRF
jgi:hypothetical protein